MCERERDKYYVCVREIYIICVFMCVCVCERERDRERDYAHCVSMYMCERENVCVFAYARACVRCFDLFH